MYQEEGGFRVQGSGKAEGQLWIQDAKSPICSLQFLIFNLQSFLNPEP